MPVHAYQKWQGPLWTFVCLAEIGHRRGDRSLLPLRDQFREWLFAERHMLPPHSLLIPGQEDRSAGARARRGSRPGAKCGSASPTGRRRS